MNEIGQERQKRLNKIASLLDRHKRLIAIQECYINAMRLAPCEGIIWEDAMEEAYRLSTYHTKESKKLEQERNMLNLLAPAESGEVA